jgi:hypothetical protein
LEEQQAQQRLAQQQQQHQQQLETVVWQGPHGATASASGAEERRVSPAQQAAGRDSPLQRQRHHNLHQDPNALELSSPTLPTRFTCPPLAKRPRTTSTSVRLFR